MAFLSAAQSASVQLIGKRPQGVFSATDPFSNELTTLANDLVQDVVKSNEWMALTKLKTMTGDGATTSFSLPSDYDRMPMTIEVEPNVWTSCGYDQAPDLNFWRRLIRGSPTITPGYWVLLGGTMQFQPALPTDQTADYYYISRNAVKSQAGAEQDSFQADTDTFVFGDRLLTLGLIWKWKAMKGLEYAEALASYEMLLSQLQTSDPGARTIRSTSQWRNRNSNYAYPYLLGQS